MLYDKRNVRNLLSVRFAYFNFIGNCISYKVKTLRGDATHVEMKMHLREELLSDYGINGQISISYDMTFLLVLLTGLYEPDTTYKEARCIAHPVHKHPVRRNKITTYVADMNVLMTYYKCVDDWQDDKKLI